MTTRHYHNNETNVQSEKFITKNILFILQR